MKRTHFQPVLREGWNVAQGNNSTTQTRYWLHADGPRPSTCCFKHDSYTSAQARERDLEILREYERATGYRLKVTTWEV